MFPGSIWPLRDITIARQILALDVIGDIASHVSARAEAASDTCEDNDPNVGVIVPSPHVFPYFGHCGVLFSRTNEGIHALRAIELDPQDATVLGLIQQIIDQLRSHRLPPSSRLGSDRQVRRAAHSRTCADGSTIALFAGHTQNT